MKILTDTHAQDIRCYQCTAIDRNARLVMQLRDLAQELHTTTHARPKLPWTLCEHPMCARTAELLADPARTKAIA